MPFTPAQISEIALEIGRIYADAETELIGRMARILAKDMDAPNWAELKMQDIARVRAIAEAEIAALNRHATPEIERTVRQAYTAGTNTAIRDLERVMDPAQISRGFSQANERAVRRFAQEAVTGARSTHTRILRQTDDIFRRVVEQSAGIGVTGTETRRQTAQRVLNQFANAGISGFRDSAGRNWDIASYTEMSTRSAMTRAAIEGNADRLREHNQNLVIVSSIDEACPLCDEWETAILSLDGEDDRYPTLDDAIADGLLHPGCRHSVSAWIEGLSEKPDRKPKHEREDRYEQTQKQRGMERNVRKWKRREAAALDDETRRQAKTKVSDWQKALREHTSEHDLVRKYQRESTTRAR